MATFAVTQLLPARAWDWQKPIRARGDTGEQCESRGDHRSREPLNLITPETRLCAAQLAAAQTNHIVDRIAQQTQADDGDEQR